MSSIKISKEFKVGFFTLLTLGILYIGFNYLKGIEFLNKTNQYYVIYDDVAGLTISNPVKINGFSVGRVSDVKILQERQNKILVELDIANDITLGEGTTALLQIDLLGSVSIVLNVTDIKDPITPGDTLKASVDPTLAELLAESALPVADNLQVTIRRINTLLEDFSNNTQSLKNIADNIEGITEKTNQILGANQQKINSTVSDFSTITTKLNKNLDELEVLLKNFNQLTDTLKNVQLNTTLTKTNDLLENINTTFDNLNDESGTLGRLMKDDSLYINLNQALIDLDSLIIHMNEYPKHFFAPLGKSKKKIERDLQKEENN